MEGPQKIDSVDQLRSFAAMFENPNSVASQSAAALQSLIDGKPVAMDPASALYTAGFGALLAPQA